MDLDVLVSLLNSNEDPGKDATRTTSSLYMRLEWSCNGLHCVLGSVRLHEVGGGRGQCLV